MDRAKLGRAVLAAAGVLMAATGVLYGSGALDRPPAETDWTDWSGTAVFFGDSITEFCDLEAFYPGLDAANRGIAGDTTGGMLERVDADVCALAPAVVVFLGGINDIGTGVDDETVISNICAIMERIRDALPKTQVLVQSVYPVVEWSPTTVNSHVRAVNERLKALAKDEGYVYVDVYSVLAGDDGQLVPDYSDDGLHPNYAGYAAAQPVIARAVRRAVARYERLQ